VGINGKDSEKRSSTTKTIEHAFTNDCEYSTHGKNSLLRCILALNNHVGTEFDQRRICASNNQMPYKASRMESDQRRTRALNNRMLYKASTVFFTELSRYVRMELHEATNEYRATSETRIDYNTELESSAHGLLRETSDEH
jgi:hypothetical protein